MVSDRTTDGPPHSVPPFLTQESSAQHHAAADRRVPLSEVGGAEFDGYGRRAAEVRPQQQFLETRHNGTDGNAVILPFSSVTHGEGRSTQSRSGHEVSIPIAAKPSRAVSDKPREKVRAVKVKTPETINGTKPPRVGVNIEWVQKGVGWDCREVYYVGKQRRRRHLGHIGKQKWEEMQEQHRGKALEEVLREWIDARRAEKSMSLKSE